MSRYEITGYCSGYIAAANLDSALVDALMYEYGKNLSYAEAELDEIGRQRTAWEDTCEAACVLAQDSGKPEPTFADFTPDLDNFSPEIWEPTIEGTYEGVTYRSSWLGGALHFFILESPIVGYFELCSPCVPGAVNLDQRRRYGEGLLGYDVPLPWRYRELADGKTFADRMGEYE